MNSIEKWLKFKLFMVVIVLLVTTVFVFNIGLYTFINIQYQTEIKREHDNLLAMTSHLGSETDKTILTTYLEHFTHTNNVILSFQDESHVMLFTNDTKSELTNYNTIYYEDTLIGYLAVSYASSSLGTEYTYGFTLLNALTFMLFFISAFILWRYIKKQTIYLKEDFSKIQTKEAIFHFSEIKELNVEWLNYLKQLEIEKKVYAAHIKELAHDIKTPLTVINIDLETLKKENKELELANDMKEELDKITSIIPKFIELNSSQLPYNQNISLFILDYVSHYQQVFNSKQIVLDFNNEPLLTKISNEDIHRLLEHLLFNAFYYSKEHTKVEIITSTKEKTLIIKDQGYGMSKALIEALLTGSYKKETNPNSHKNSSGIGYQIILDIIKRINAKIDIQSELNKGTHITIYFQ